MTLHQLLLRAYPSPEWAVFFEVAERTGYSRRRADSVAMGIWPSRGLAILGFEFKSHRSDWLRELKAPAKADAVATQCDRWWIVAGAADVVRIEELPDRWGLLVPNEARTKLVTVRAAEPFPDRDKISLRRDFAASLLRKVPQTMTPNADVERRIADAVDQALAQSTQGSEIERLRRRIASLEATIDGFKETTGVDLRGWQGPKIAHAVAAVLNTPQTRRTLEQQAIALGSMEQRIRAALAELPPELIP